MRIATYITKHPYTTPLLRILVFWLGSYPLALLLRVHVGRYGSPCLPHSRRSQIPRRVVRVSSTPGAVSGAHNSTLPAIHVHSAAARRNAQGRTCAQNRMRAGAQAGRARHLRCSCARLLVHYLLQDVVVVVVFFFYFLW